MMLFLVVFFYYLFKGEVQPSWWILATPFLIALMAIFALGLGPDHRSSIIGEKAQEAEKDDASDPACGKAHVPTGAPIQQSYKSKHDEAAPGSSGGDKHGGNTGDKMARKQPTRRKQHD